MSPLRRTVATAVMAGFALVLVSCGVDPGDAASTTSSSPSGGDVTTTTPDADLTPAQREAVDRVTRLYEDLGMDPDDAECLAQGIAGAMDTLDPTDPGQMMDLVNECDIPLSELNDLGADQGLNSMEDGLKFGLETTLTELGLTDDEASCVADAFVDQYGSDVNAAQDPTRMRPIFEDCGVDPSLIGN